MSQLSRAVETRGGTKRPLLSDLRESGAIEQDSDMVIFLYRPEYYGITDDSNQSPTPGLTEVIIAKHRNGQTCKIDLKFVSKYIKFKSLDELDSFGEKTSTLTRSSKLNEMEDDQGGNPF